MARILGQRVVDGRVAHGDTDYRMCRDVGHALAAEVHAAAVTQAGHILVNRSKRHEGRDDTPDNRDSPALSERSVSKGDS